MMKNIRETTSVVALGSATEERDAVKEAFQEVQSSFETFCLLAGIEAFQDLLEEEAADLCGERHQRHEDRRGRRWGKARSPVAFHGGRVEVRLPDGDIASAKSDGTSKSAVSRKFVALSSAKLKHWLASDLSSLDLLAIQICTSRRT